MDCRIIQDLLPLYAEKLTSDVTDKEVEEHLKSCPECMDKLEALTAETVSEPMPDRDIKPLKKARHSLLFRIPAIMLGAALVLGTVFLFVFWGVIPISSEDLGIEIRISGSENDIKLDIIDEDNNKTGEQVIRRPLDLTFTGNCSCMRKSGSVHYDYNPDGSMTAHYYMTFYKEKKLPFDDVGEHPEQFRFGLEPRKGDTLTVHCRDRDLTYDLWELYQRYSD